VALAQSFIVKFATSTSNSQSAIKCTWAINIAKLVLIYKTENVFVYNSIPFEF